MKAILICPSDRPSVAFFSRTRPLALTPILGRSLLDLTLAEVASQGATEILILADDRPEEIRRAVGKGEAWGVKAEVLPESQELSYDEARRKYVHRQPTGWLPAPLDVRVIDRIAGTAPLWTDPGTWFSSLRHHIPAAACQRVGYRELSPGIWLHVRARVAQNARLEAPCWIGAFATVRPSARVGPGAIIEDHAYIDDGAEVTESFVGPATYVGALTDLRQSLAWGRGLFKWTTGSFTEVQDSFLLGELSGRAHRKRTSNLAGRALALVALAAFSPVALAAWFRKPPGTPWFVQRYGVRAPVTNALLTEVCRYHELNGVSGIWRRWPQLLNVARGEFAWVGNRPLSPEQAADLYTDFERLWLSVPPGIVSLADAEQCPDPVGDEARAHASFYAVQRNLSQDLHILGKALRRLALHSS
ncbi:MAG: sugar transferase [Verrucomicrobiales bacterium]|nr:sugar transferase [Verrucomicrobiales bacterium]